MLRRAGLIVAIAALVAPSAWGATDRDICEDEKASSDATLAACTRIITAGETKGEDLAITYYNRAISYRQKNDNESALSDYNDSIRLNPKYAKSFNNRGNIWKDKGDIDRAIAD
jgi:tetratricopeptide (TPR) repeat protein